MRGVKLYICPRQRSEKGWLSNNANAKVSLTFAFVSLLLLVPCLSIPIMDCCPEVTATVGQQRVLFRGTQPQLPNHILTEQNPEKAPIRKCVTKGLSIATQTRPTQNCQKTKRSPPTEQIQRALGWMNGHWVLQMEENYHKPPGTNQTTNFWSVHLGSQLHFNLSKLGCWETFPHHLLPPKVEIYIDKNWLPKKYIHIYIQSTYKTVTHLPQKRDTMASVARELIPKNGVTPAKVLPHPLWRVASGNHL